MQHSETGRPSPGPEWELRIPMLFMLFKEIYTAAQFMFSLTVWRQAQGQFSTAHSKCNLLVNSTVTPNMFKRMQSKPQLQSYFLVFPNT